jgi:hypothetical protein
MLRPLVLALAGWGALPVVAGESLVVDDVPALVTDQGGTVTVPLSLRNTGTEPAAIRLNVSDFEHQSQNAKTYPLGAAFAFTAVSESDKVVLNGLKDLAPGAVLTVKLTVSKLWEAGESIAVLKNGDADIRTRSGAPRCTLRAIHIPQAFNVRIDDGASNSPEVRFSSLFSSGRNVLVRLVNSDPMSYRFRWMLRLGNDLRAGPNPYIDIPGNGSVFLDLSSVGPKPDGLFGWISQLITTGTLKDDIENGDLILQPLLAQSPIPPVASKVLPISARFRFWTDGFQEFANVICVFFLLTIGGIASIWVHCGMPNTTRALALQNRLSALDKQIAALGTDIASQWRVLLASQPKRLCKSLSSMWWVFPAFAETLNRIEKDVAMAETWGAIAYDISILRRQTRQQLQNGIPPTVLAWIEDSCGRALAPIETGFTNDEELQAMHADVRRAREYLALLARGTQIADLEKEVADREARLRPLLPAVAQAWPLEFGNLVEQVSSAIGTPMVPDLYIDRDTLSIKVDLLNEFRELWNRALALKPAVMAAAVGGGGDAVPSDSALGRLCAHRERLFDYLRPDAADSLRLARLFVTEMRQDIYEPALLVEVEKKPPAMNIAMEPAIAEPGAPVHFALRFNRGILNEAAVCHEWTCTWHFGDGCQCEAGWDVYHSFCNSCIYQVSVQIANLDGKSVSEATIRKEVQAGQHVGPISTGDRLVRAWKWMKPHAETMLEASRLALVLAIAVFGLVATARQQASTLTLLEAIGAVFALGFGANTLRNLITDRRS